MKSVGVKSTGAVALLLAVVLAGALYQSDRKKADTSQQPGSSSTSTVSGDTGQGRTASLSSQSAGQYRGGAAGISMSRDQVNQKLTQNEQEISAVQDRIQRIQGDLQSANFDQQIQQQQQVVMDLQAQTRVGNAQDASVQLQNQAIFTEQNFQILQQRINVLQQQIQNQQNVSNLIEERLRNTYAPDTSDLMVSLNDQLQASENHKRTLQSEYDSLFQQQQQLAANRYSTQARQQQQQQAGAVSTDVALEQAKSRLDTLNREKQQLQGEVDQEKRTLDQLQSERSSLLSQTQYAQ
jgi:chromosome segregation ATPase